VRHPADHIFAHAPDSLADWCLDHGLKRFRATQILEWVYRHGVADPARMTNLSRADRETLARNLTFLSGDVLGHQQATDGVQKLLVQWKQVGPTAREGLANTPQGATRPRTREDTEPAAEGTKGNGEATHGSPNSPSPAPSGEGVERSETEGVSSRPPSISLPLADAITSDATRQTECVMIPAEGGPAFQAGRRSPAHQTPSENRATRRTACISSQVGCPVGCRFCASGLGGLDGNLSAGRIVEQAWLLNQLDHVDRITNIVFMGMGEPLANLSNVIRAVRVLNAPWGMGISARRITISTVGLPKAIEKLADQLDVPVTLALSLHAPNDRIRRELIPWAEYSTIQQLLDACRLWFDKTGREVTLEYILLGGVNDQPEHARELADVARTMRANVNLIRYNEVAGLPYRRPSADDVHEFQRILRDRRVNAHIRASRGRDIAAACGQLRHETASNAAKGARAAHAPEPRNA